MNRFIAVGSLCAGLAWTAFGTHPPAAFGQEAPRGARGPSVGPLSPSEEFSEGLNALEALNKQHEAAMEQWRRKYLKRPSEPAAPAEDDDLFAPRSTEPPHVGDIFAPRSQSHSNPSQPRSGTALPAPDDRGSLFSAEPPPDFNPSAPDTRNPRRGPSNTLPVLNPYEEEARVKRSPVPSTEDEAVPAPSSVFPPGIESDPGPPTPGEIVLENPLLPPIGAKDDGIRPLPLPPIPDDPPPHEGAMINMPVLVKPPDLLVVEVLEAFPGRPITGERLVRPDGTITLGFYGDVQVRGLTLGQVKTRIILHLRKYLTDEVLGLTGFASDGNPIVIQPAESDRVFVDFAAYNSDVYFVQGWVNKCGRLPCTGRDTVLDALNYAGGPAAGSDVDAIHLFRPARGDQPKKVYKIDYQALIGGDPKANLQIFANDRLYVGPKTTAEQNDGKSETKASPTLQISRDIRSLETAIRKIDATPAQRRAVADRVIDLYVHATTAPGSEPLDESRVRADMKAILDLVAPPKEKENTELDEN